MSKKEEVRDALGLADLPGDELTQLLDEAGDQSLEQAIVARSVGTLLAEARAQSGRTLREVGAAAGVSFGRIQQLEQSENVEVSTLVRVAAALGYGVKITFEPKLAGRRRSRLKTITAEIPALKNA
jgi:hypothetical protein